ncbi:helix-turn-helix domain-containing protein [Pseudonocardia sp. KRD-184]|uniref:helix-turn-helix domain-containing protein n=1 Tax=Pseudonocardia oceani TaxID=2792013 RepID=UPI001C4A0B4D|nr:helix-turn-helix transcriptional regulator [Pseudonocardia oceani]MBW0090023.1 helix-turn-helix domain-containing protein [Pseudonocardia oceani]MBW0097075.1 helix-turn-helix domain-containing protein [Pseudonocardia oceani]
MVTARSVTRREGTALPTTRPAAQRRRLGTELRELRERADLRIDDAAAELRCSTSKISRLENGKTPPQERDVRDLVRFYGGSIEVGERLQEMARSGQDNGWWGDEFKDVFTDRLVAEQLKEYVQLEEYASAITSYTADVVPGLLQTESYITALTELLFSNHDAELRKRFVEFRLRRQRILHRDDAPRLRFLISEGTLRQPVGGSDVATQQLDAISKRIVENDPSCVVRIVPLIAVSPALYGGSFSVIVFDDPADQDTVLVEGRNAPTYLKSDADVERYGQSFAEIEKVSLDAGASLDAIEEARAILRQI